MTENQPEKLELHSLDIAEGRRQELLRLFPEVGTEGGKVDFERLKLALGEAVDTGKERYGMSWPGKADCFLTIQAPSLATLRPRPEESINFDATDNLIIEGDNLEVLKLLQKSYLGKVKMIYIDPPYNTGNDFIYPDNYTESLQTYLEYTGQVDAEGRKFGTNTDADGRFHSKWLNMMYPRLYLARNLLREDGVIFISIDDGEVASLKALVNDVFGEENCIALFVWEKRTTRENRRVFSFNHEYVLCAARDKGAFEEVRNLLPLSSEARARYLNPDNDPRGPWQSVSLNAQAGHGTAEQFYSLTTPGGRTVDPPPGRCWVVTKLRLAELIADNRVWFGDSGNNVPRRKVFFSEATAGLTPHTLWTSAEVGTNDAAKKELIELFDGVSVFDTPKPASLTRRMLEIAATADDIILDFFAGSGTTAQAVLELNRQDAGNRKFILVQLPEPTGRDDYPTIADITKERVRRVIKKLDDEDAGRLDLSDGQVQDRGFRVFKLAESNFTPWNADVPRDAASLVEQLEMHVEHIREGRTAADLLYEILLKSGFPLTTPVESLGLAGVTVHSVVGGAVTGRPIPDLLAYLQNETELTRSTLARILRESGRLDEFFCDPQRFLDAVAAVLKYELHRLLVDGIKYERIDGSHPEAEWEMLLFKNEELINYLAALKVGKSVYEYVVYESEVEREFARRLDERDDIKLFVKLLGWFRVDTPLGEYNPDWALLKDDGEAVYLARETKGTRDFLKLRTGEADKVRCGQRHFEALGVPFAVVVTADEV